MRKLSCSQVPTQDTKILFNFNIWVGYGLSLDHTGQNKLYKPQQKSVVPPLSIPLQRCYCKNSVYIAIAVTNQRTIIGFKQPA